jgi:hypothetical protein
MVQFFFICRRNANGFIKGNQPESFYWNSCRFGEGRDRKFYNPARIVMEMLSTCPHFIKGKKFIRLMLDSLFSE